MTVLDFLWAIVEAFPRFEEEGLPLPTIEKKFRGVKVTPKGYLKTDENPVLVSKDFPLDEYSIHSMINNAVSRNLVESSNRQITLTSDGRKGIGL